MELETNQTYRSSIVGSIQADQSMINILNLSTAHSSSTHKHTKGGKKKRKTQFN